MISVTDKNNVEWIDFTDYPSDFYGVDMITVVHGEPCLCEDDAK